MSKNNYFCLGKQLLRSQHIIHKSLITKDLLYQ
jgi:hypothetical protein